MTSTESQSEHERLITAIALMEAQRDSLGDDVVDLAIGSMRKQLAELEKANRPDQRKLVTVLFMDMVGSTETTRELDPEENLALMDRVMQLLSEPIRQVGGQVLRYMGDGFMAVFGLPRAHENDPIMAIRAGLAILETAGEYVHELDGQQVLNDLQVRIGIDTGWVASSGHVDSENSIMGMTINLAARLESAAESGQLLISHHTYQHVRGIFDLQPLEPIEAKGFPELVPVYRVLRAKERSFRTRSRGVEGLEIRMVGREAEMKALQDAYYTVVEDKEWQAVTIVGDAGLGKSRLLYEFENWADLQFHKLTIYRGRARYETKQLPFAILRDVFASRFEIQDDDLPHVVREKTVEGFEQTLGASETTEMKAHHVGYMLGYDFSASPHLRTQEKDARQLWDQALTYLTDYFRTASAHRPLLTLLEDLHWADNSSLHAISRLATALDGYPVLLVGTTRPSLYQKQPHWFEGRTSHDRLDLRPLSKRDSRILVSDVLQKLESIPAALSEMVVTNADGNPFYVEEFIKMLIEEDVIIKGEPYWHVVPDRLAEVRVPPTLAGVLQARLDSLPEEERILLQQASVVGRTFWDAAIATFSQSNGGGRSIEDIQQGLNALRKREMIFHRDLSTFAGTQEYIFKHAILRQVTYESVLLRYRKEYHLKTANWIVEQSGERVSEVAGLIAEHLEQAGDIKAAISYLDQAGERATRLFAMGEALRFYDQAIDLAMSHPNVVDNSFIDHLFEVRGLNRAQAGEFVGAERDLKRALSVLTESDETARKQELLINLGMVYRRTDDYDNAKVQLQQALTYARSSGELRSVADALFHLGSVYWSEGEILKTIALAEEAVDICRNLKLEDRVAIQAYHGLAECYFQAGDGVNSEKYFLESLNLARRLGDKSYEVENLYMISVINQGYILANYEVAINHAQQAFSICESLQMDWHREAVLFNLGYALMAHGEYQQGFNYIEQSLELTERLGLPYHRSIVLGLLGNLYRDLGLLEKAIDAHIEGLDIALASKAGNWLPRIQTNLVIDQIRFGDLAGEDELKAALNVSRRRGQLLHVSLALQGLAELAYAKRIWEMSLDYADQLLTLARQGGMRERMAQAFRWRGLALMALKQTEAAREELVKAAGLAKEIGRPRLQWEVHEALAQYHRHQDEQDKAQEHEIEINRIVEAIDQSLEDETLKSRLPLS